MTHLLDRNAKTLLEVNARLKIRKASVVAGVDEAGRGPLAGPVVAASCVLPEGVTFAGIDDSKRLRADMREELYSKITSHPRVSWGVGVVEAADIDEINILQATLKAMAEAVNALPCKPEYLLVDGKQLPVTLIPGEGIIGGDRIIPAISAASIIAKVERDRIMTFASKLYPGYGLDGHMGYGTKAHRSAIALSGPSPIHRLSFRGVRRDP